MYKSLAMIGQSFDKYAGPPPPVRTRAFLTNHSLPCHSMQYAVPGDTRLKYDNFICSKNRSFVSI